MALSENRIQKQLKGKSLLTLHEMTSEEIMEILKVADKLKDMSKKGIPHQVLEGKSLAMIFTKSSTRTRVSFEVGMHQLGGQALFLSSNDIQLGRGETISDTAQVLSRYVHGIMIRTFAQQDVIDLAKYGTIPVINGLTDLVHPCQVLADLQTIREHKGTLKGLKMAYIGDGNNMAHSLMVGGAKVGMDVSIACPKDYYPNAEVVNWAKEDADATGAKIVVTEDPIEAVKNADIIYTDVWASMGQEAEQAKRVKDFASYQVNEELAAHAKKDYIFLHCLPAHRGEEVSVGVIDGPNSVIFDEAENRLHAQKAVMALTM